METLNLSLDIFKKVVYQNIPFSLAVKNEWKNKNVSNDVRTAVSGLVGCTLRHYLVFELRIKEYFENYTEDIFSICALTLANTFFLKKISQKDFDALAKNSLTKEELTIYKKLVNDFSDSSHLIPDSIKPNSVEFLSYRYNTPLWLVKMWNKHYGLNALYKILKSNSRPSDIYVKTLFNDPVINDNFEKTDKNNFYKYVGNEALKRNELYITRKMFPYPYGMQELVDGLDIDPIRGIAIYSGYANNLLLDLVSRTSKYLKIDVISPTFQCLYETKKNIAQYGFENVRLYEAAASSMITCVSEKVHTFFVLPNSTRFSLLKTTPDYFLRLDQNKMDSLMASEREAIDEAKDFVDVGGSLIYCIDTVSQKEGHLLIESFIRDNQNFKVVEEKQILGFGQSSSMYYAILKKESEND